MHPSTSLVGVDWGVVNFVTMSNGEVVGQCAPLEQHARKLVKWQRRLARKKKFSNNWKKAKARISKLHQHIANIRKDFVHKTDSISKNHAVVVVEGLQVKNLSQSARKNVKAKSRMNRAILDAPPFELRRQLEYKMRWRGGLLVAVPPGNTSRSCPECGQVAAAENRKTQARFVSVACGFRVPADLVAASNIKEAGLASLAWSHSSGTHRRHRCLAGEPEGIPNP